MRDTFILYTEYAEQIGLLSDTQAGTLLKAILAFNADEELPKMDALTKMAFLNISNQMRRDAEKYDKMVAQRSAAGRRNGKAKAEEPKIEDVPEEPKPDESDKSEEWENNLVQRENNLVKRENNLVKRGTDVVEHNEDEDVDEDEDVNVDDKKKREKREKRASRFSPPSPDEVAQYCRERGCKVDPDAFMDFYTSKGWKVGNQPMKDWKAAVRTWEKRDNRSGTQEKPRGQTLSRMSDYNGFDQRTYDYDELKRQLLRR